MSFIKKGALFFGLMLYKNSGQVFLMNKTRFGYYLDFVTISINLLMLLFDKLITFIYNLIDNKDTYY